MSLQTMLKNVLKMKIEKLPVNKIGRPKKITTDDAIESIFLLVRTGMQ